MIVTISGVSTGGTTCEIRAVKVVENYENKMVMNFPIPSGSTGSVNPDVLLLSLGQAQRSISISGRIDADSITGGTSAHSVLNSLRDTVQDTNGCHVAITDNAGTSYLIPSISSTATYMTGFINKMQASSYPADMDIPTWYDIDLVFVEGSDAKTYTP